MASPPAESNPRRVSLATCRNFPRYLKRKVTDLQLSGYNFFTRNELKPLFRNVVGNFNVRDAFRDSAAEGFAATLPVQRLLIGIEQAFAVQAGREMRVIVNSQLTTDESAAKTCRDIVKELTARLQFPGEIKVTVIRETRATDIAK